MGSQRPWGVSCSVQPYQSLARQGDFGLREPEHRPVGSTGLAASSGASCCRFSSLVVVIFCFCLTGKWFLKPTDG